MAMKRFEICVFEADTLIRLLQSPEKGVALKALDALRDFYYARPDEQVDDKVLINLLLPLLSEIDTKVVASAMQLLDLMMRRSESLLMYVTKNHSIFEILMTYYKEDQPDILKEVSSNILAVTTRNTMVSRRFAKHPNFASIFSNIVSPDIDVVHNSLLILQNLLKDLHSASDVVNHSLFFYAPIISSIENPYPQVQYLALDILLDLTSRKVKLLDLLFRQEASPSKLINLLLYYAWEDLHHKLLACLLNIIVDKYSIEELKESDVKSLLSYINTIGVDVLIGDALVLISRLAANPMQAEILLNAGIVYKCIGYIRAGNIDFAESSIKTLGAIVTTSTIAFKQAEDEDPIPMLMAQFDPVYPWNIREAALVAVQNMIERSRTLLSIFLGSYQLEDISQQTLGEENAPLSVKIAFIQCLKTILQQLPPDTTVISKETLLHLLQTMRTCNHDSSKSELEIVIIQILCMIFQQSRTRDLLRKLGGVTVVRDCLLNSIHNLPVLEHYSVLLQTIVSTDTVLANALIYVGLLEWLVTHDYMFETHPPLEAIMKTIFKKCLFAKFAYTGQLDLDDRIEHGFFVTSRNYILQKKCKVLTDLLKNEDPTIIIYVVNFKQPDPSRSTLSKSTFSKSTLDKSVSCSFEEDLFLEDGTRIDSSLFDDSILDPDYNLNRYIECLSEQVDSLGRLRGLEAVYNRDYVLQLIQLIVEIVMHAMGQEDMGKPCNNHALELYLQQLQKKLRSNAIPVGFIRRGLKLERALLFKVLADQEQLKCKLVRGQYSNCWVEVVVPNAEDDRVIAPPDLLTTNYIVDLIGKPGTLIPVCTEQARLYTGYSCKPPYHWQRN